MGISKIKRYRHFRDVLGKDFPNLVQNVDFLYHPEIAEAAMRYLNASSYGETVLDAVIGYKDSRFGTKAMKSMVIAMIRGRRRTTALCRQTPP